MILEYSISSEELIEKLSTFGYEVTRKTLIHVRLTTQKNGEDTITIPVHDSIKFATLNAILKDVSNHLDLSSDELLKLLF